MFFIFQVLQFLSHANFSYDILDFGDWDIEFRALISSIRKPNQLGVIVKLFNNFEPHSIIIDWNHCSDDVREIGSRVTKNPSHITYTSSVSNRHRTMPTWFFIIIHPSDNIHQTHCRFVANVLCMSRFVIILRIPVIIFGYLLDSFFFAVQFKIKWYRVGNREGLDVKRIELNMNYDHPLFNDML